MSLTLNVKKGTANISEQISLKKGGDFSTALDNLVSVNYSQHKVRVMNRTSGTPFIILNAEDPKALVFDVDQDNFPVVRLEAEKKAKKRKEAEGEDGAQKKEPAKKKQKTQDGVISTSTNGADTAIIVEVPKKSETSKKSIKTAKVTVMSGLAQDQEDGGSNGIYKVLGLQ